MSAAFMSYGPDAGEARVPEVRFRCASRPVVRRERIKWGRIQHLLAGNLPGTIGQRDDERFAWVHRHGLVKQALDEILGQNGWRTETRDRSQWVFATDRARPRSTVPEPPADRSPDDDLGPPPGEPPF